MVSRPAAKQTKFGSSLCDLWLWSLNSLSLYFLMYTYVKVIILVYTGIWYSVNRSAVADGSIGRNIGSCSRGLITPWLFEIPKNCHLQSYAGTCPPLPPQPSLQTANRASYILGWFKAGLLRSQFSYQKTLHMLSHKVLVDVERHKRILQG